MVLVGTEEAFGILCRKQYLARRTGDIIDASKYCYDYEKFCIRMTELMKFNWFRPDTLAFGNQELLPVLYEETHGTIDRMVSLWIDVQIAYATAKSKPAITGDFIRLVSARANPLLSYYTGEALEYSSLAQLENDKNHYQDQNLQGDSTFPARNMRQNKADSILLKKLTTSSNPEQAKRVYERVKETLIYIGRNFRDDTIIEAVARIMQRKTSTGADDITLVRNTMKYLEKKKTDSRPVKNSISDRLAPKTDPDKIIEDFTSEFIDRH